MAELTDFFRVIIEFKVDQKEQALAQIKRKKYFQKYQESSQKSGQEIYIVGICFDSGEKNIIEFEWEVVA